MPRRKRKDCKENPFETGDHASDLRKLAVDCISEYFQDKRFFCGGDIPQRDLFSEHSVKTVLRTQLDDRCFDFIHAECLPMVRQPKTYSDPTVPWNIHYLLSLLADLQSRQLPKEYFPGLLLLYFKFCHGSEIMEPPLL
jgi:hypothetical protein